MKVTTHAEQRKAKIRFALIYTLSLVLVFVAVSAFWKKLGAGKASETPVVASQAEAFFMQADTALHTRLERYDAAARNYLQARQNGGEANAASLYAARSAFGNALDSMERQAAYLTDGPKKEMMVLAATGFRKELQTRESLLNSVVALPKLSTPASVAVPATDNAEVEALKKQLQEKDATIATLQAQTAARPADNAEAEALKKQLREKEAVIATLQTQAAAKPASGNGDAQLRTAVAEKDRLIASLQTQLKQKDAALQAASSAPRSTPTSGGEWQQKYNALKSSFDKVSASEKSLKTSYQTLADDNRRLLSQLQSARKG